MPLSAAGPPVGIGLLALEVGSDHTGIPTWAAFRGTCHGNNPHPTSSRTM